MPIHHVAEGDPRKRAMIFLDAYMRAPADADLEIRGGRDDRGSPALAVTLCGTLHAFTCAEARIVSDIAEDTMRHFPQSADVWSNLIVALRGAADRVERDGDLSKPINN